ncbi:uncharacterized protein At2g02148 isoform X2 [Daucus carota subsp. sativus]|uniref:uncharacterized protein At2g02148 isoform X2 n=1 Tax=Daucus carota subsp. sativus TaxID=79200 RepID=UPI0007EF0438|nr:PREDICTED: uncharacterized protein At2g02148 isoform X2 [Daucus carota subsp. sativus]
METRVPVPSYNLRSNSSYIDGSKSARDLDNGDGRHVGEIDGTEHDGVTGGDLDNDGESSAVDCLHETYGNSLPLPCVGVDEDRSSIENNGPSIDPYGVCTIEDVTPIEAARARFLDILVNHFISSHVTEARDPEADYITQAAEDKASKRKSREILYEGDARYVLPMMYVANMYETLVNEVNMKLSSVNGMREKSIGVPLEAAGGLYRKLAKKFPKKGTCVFKRRELATSMETRSRFPELVIQDEKRVRFVVVNGLAIIERPTDVGIGDAEWFKRLTGRNEVAISAADYKFYAPRHKYRRVSSSNSISNVHGLPSFSNTDSASPMTTSQGYHPITEPQQQQISSNHHIQTLSHSGQFHALHQSQHQSINQSQHVGHFSHNHQCGPSSHLPDVADGQQPTSISQHMACIQPLAHAAGRLHPSGPPKYCDECGSPYLRETSKFCSECGFKRLGI